MTPNKNGMPSPNVRPRISPMSGPAETKQNKMIKELQKLTKEIPNMKE
jgi:hypothetical protein